uniref:Uncharacterized protein n=1 Tax=Nelumbo nucifera TaxID=4432 RepID=A0A822ZKL9_NELNU|nr:TPA_asm: hypothetical protein HUJ06_003290 [Nelumbo nucifera]
MKVAVSLVFVLLILAVSSEVVRCGTPRLPLAVDPRRDQTFEKPLKNCKICCIFNPVAGGHCDCCELLVKKNGKVYSNQHE